MRTDKLLSNKTVAEAEKPQLQSMKGRGREALRYSKVGDSPWPGSLGSLSRVRSEALVSGLAPAANFFQPDTSTLERAIGPSDDRLQT